MFKKTWLAVIGVSLALLLAGCGTANTASSASPAQQGGTGQNPQGGRGNASPQQRQQFLQALRAGKVVSLTATSVTLNVQRGGADVGTNATYNLTGSTTVRKDRSTVSTSGQVPDLAVLGLKVGFYATLRVNAGNVVSVQFNSDGSQPQGPPHNGNGSPPNQNGSAPSQ